MSRSRARTLALAAVPALVPVVVFWKALLGRTLLAPGDGFVYYLPVHILTADAWRSGHVPGWNEYAFSGSPLLASAQAGPFYPPNLLFLVLPWLWANNLVLVLDLALAGIGAFLLARTLTGDEAAAATAGAAFASSGFLYGHIAHQSIEAAVAWFPWMLYGYEKLRERPTATRLLLTCGAIALSLLGGHYQVSFFCVAVLVLYAGAAAAFAHPALRPWLERAVCAAAALLVLELVIPSILESTLARRAVAALLLLLVLGAFAPLARRLPRPRLPSVGAWLAAAVAGGAALAAVQLVPTLRILGHTLRADTTFAYATSYSFSAAQLPLLLFPYLFGTDFPSGPYHGPYAGQWNLTELAGYPGLAAVVLAAAGWRRSRRDPRALALVAVAGFGLAVALGAGTSLGSLVWHIPPFGGFRAWARYVVALDLAVAILAAYGVAHLRASFGRERRAALARASVAAFVIAVAAGVLPQLPAVSHQLGVRSTAHLAAAVPVAAALGAACLCLLFGSARRAATIGCCVLVAADGFLAFGGFFEWRIAPSPAAARSAYSHTQPPPWGPTPDRPGGIDRYLFAGNDAFAVRLFSPQVTAVKAIRSANGLDPLAPTPYVGLVGSMQDAGNLARPEEFLSRRSRLLDLLRVSLVVVPVAEAPKPAPSWATATRRAHGLVAYEYRPRLPDAFIVGGGGRVSAERRGTGAIDLTVDARRSGLLVVSEAWYPGWRATVDGRGVAVVRTHSVALGVRIPAGPHRVSLRYRIPGFRAGAAISLAALVLLCVAAIVHRRHLKRAAGIEPA